MTPDQIPAFRAELKALVLKYEPEISVATTYYDDVIAVNFCAGDVIAVSAAIDFQGWDFDERDGDGVLRPMKTLKELRG